jgi:hypothetical protein
MIEGRNDQEPVDLLRRQDVRRGQDVRDVRRIEAAPEDSDAGHSD